MSKSSTTKQNIKKTDLQDSPDDLTSVTKEEVDLLQQSSESMATEDDLRLKQAEVDSTDDEGTPLNVSTDLSGEDLDVPGSELDDDMGDDDEENNSYSLNDDKEDSTNTLQ